MRIILRTIFGTTVWLHTSWKHYLELAWEPSWEPCLKLSLESSSELSRCDCKDDHSRSMRPCPSPPLRRGPKKNKDPQQGKWCLTGSIRILPTGYKLDKSGFSWLSFLSSVQLGHHVLGALQRLPRITEGTCAAIVRMCANQSSTFHISF